MRNIIFLGSLFFTLLIVFQNCSSNHLEDNIDSSETERSLYYPYSEKTQFFETIQLVQKTKNSDTWDYQFIASIVFIDDEDLLIDVEFDFLDKNDTPICPTFFAEVNRLNNHIVIDKCISTSDVDYIKVKIRAAPSGAALVLTREIELAIL